jgi:hypothetical protein
VTAPRSRFHLERAAAGPAPARLSARLPGGGGEVVVRVDGVVAGRLRFGTRWTACALTLELRAGLNAIELEWPPPAPVPDALEAAARCLERGAYPEVLPAFGELDSFTVG